MRFIGQGYFPSQDIRSNPHVSQEGRSRGRDSRSRGRDGRSRGQDGGSSGQDGSSHGQDSRSHGRDGRSRGRDGRSRGQDGGSSGQDGSSRGQGGRSSDALSATLYRYSLTVLPVERKGDAQMAMREYEGDSIKPYDPPKPPAQTQGQSTRRPASLPSQSLAKRPSKSRTSVTGPGSGHQASEGQPSNGHPLNASKQVMLDPPPVLQVIDYRCCSGKACKGFMSAMEAQKGWTKSQIDMQIPRDDEFQDTLDIGISLPTTGDQGNSAGLDPILVFFFAIPYFGTRQISTGRGVAKSGPGGQEGAKHENQSLPESQSLFEYRYPGEEPIPRNYYGEHEIMVHRAWFMIFANDTIAIFRSKEDNPKDSPPHLYGCQERVCMFRVLVHIISNILAVSQRRCHMILKRAVHRNDIEIDRYIRNVISQSGEINKDDEGMAALSQRAWGLMGDIKSAKQVVQLQIDAMRDIQRFYGNVNSSLGFTEEQIVPAIKRIEEIITELLWFSQKTDDLLVTLRCSKGDLAQMNTSEKTIDAMKHQRQVMSTLTILTTVFLPLGFFTSLYGMAGDEQKRNHPHSFYWPGGTVAGISLFITLITLVATLIVVYKSRTPEEKMMFRRSKTSETSANAPDTKQDESELGEKHRGDLNV